MSGSELSVLEDLRGVAVKLNLPKDDDDAVQLYDMCQEDIAYMINKYYQVIHYC